jgi:hypothetical protein
MTSNRRGTQPKRTRQEPEAQKRRQVEQSRGSTTGSSSNEEVGEESTNGGDDEPVVPRTVNVGEEGSGEFVRGDNTLEDESSTTGGSNTVVTTTSDWERNEKWRLHRSNIGQKVRGEIFYQMPYIEHNEEECGYGSTFQRVVCRISGVDKSYEQTLWNTMGKREARKGLNDKRKTVTSAMQKEFKSKLQLIDPTQLTVMV